MHAVQVHSRATSAVKVLPAVAGGLVIAAATSLPALCPFRLWSGHACPLCGMTRAARSEAAILAAVYARTRSHPPAELKSALIAVNAVAFFATWVLRWRYGLLDFVVAGS